MLILILQDANGCQTEAVVLTADAATMRVALRGGGDTLELRRYDEIWVSEDDRAFSIDAAVAPPQCGLQTNTKYSAASARVRTAASASLSSNSGFAIN